MKRAALLLLLTACGGPEFDVLARTTSNDAVVFTCPDGAFVSFPIVRMTGVPDMTPNLEESLGCLGIGERCPDGTPLPDDPMCDDANVNRFRGTCVETFFACYQPGGMCTNVDTNGSQSWSNGARFALDISGQYFAAGSDEPCVLVENDFSSGDANLYLKER